MNREELVKDYSWPWDAQVAGILQGCAGLSSDFWIGALCGSRLFLKQELIPPVEACSFEFWQGVCQGYGMMAQSLPGGSIWSWLVTGERPVVRTEPEVIRAADGFYLTPAYFRNVPDKVEWLAEFVANCAFGEEEPSAASLTGGAGI